MKALILFIFTSALFGDELANEVYSQIRDICHPTLEDYVLIQDYLSNEYRPFLDRLDPWQYRGKALEFRFIGRTPEEEIEYGIIPVHCSPEERENCLLLYSSFNYDYPKGVRTIIEKVKHSDFKGHIIYRIGGWPDLEGGSLQYAHIPFSFKVFCFQEAIKMGFKKAFWLDASIMPVCSLNAIFGEIKEKGCFTYATGYNLKEMCTEAVTGYDQRYYAAERVFSLLGASYSDAGKMPAFAAGILGFDLENPRAREAIDRWLEITKNHEEAYYSARQELTVISIILNQLGFTAKAGKDYATYDAKELDRPGLEFFIDKYLTQPNWPN